MGLCGGQQPWASAGCRSQVLGNLCLSPPYQPAAWLIDLSGSVAPTCLREGGVAVPIILRGLHSTDDCQSAPRGYRLVLDGQAAPLHGLTRLYKTQASSACLTTFAGW